MHWTQRVRAAGKQVFDASSVEYRPSCMLALVEDTLAHEREYLF